MKKLTKLHMILIALLIAVVAVSAYFSFSYREAEAKQPDLETAITLARMRLIDAQEEMNPEPLQRQFEEKQAELNMLTRDEPLFPEKPPTVEIGDLIVDVVERLKLTLLKLSPDDQAGTITIKSSEDSQGNKYSKAEYEVRVKGDLGRINSIIGEIEGADFGTLTIEDMDIEFEEKVVDERTIEWWEAEFIVVTIYQYQEEK